MFAFVNKIFITILSQEHVFAIHLTPPVVIGICQLDVSNVHNYANATTQVVLNANSKLIERFLDLLLTLIYVSVLVCQRIPKLTINVS
jgi:hypothetical protein